jgi:pimeloyl-ACP methyl ester carboxylesterase
MGFVKVNNYNINYTVEGSGESLLFIHGLGSDSTDWEKQIDYFSPHFKVIAIDLRGHGKSEKIKEKITIEDFAEDVYKVLMTIDADNVHIVGLSLGGMIALDLAVKHPEIIKTLTIVNSRPEYKLRSLRQFFSGLSRLIIIQLFGMKASAAHIVKQIFPQPEQEDIRKRFVAKWMLNDKKSYIKTLLAIAGWNIETELHKIKCPVLIIASEFDYTSVDFKRQYKQKIFDSKLIIITDSYHAVTEDQPEKLNSVLADFLKGN